MTSTNIQEQQALLSDRNQANPPVVHHEVHSSAVDNSITRSNMTQECFNCKVTQTPLWRRSPDGNHLCNACGLYFKTHNAHRPIYWKADTIKRRRRRRRDEYGVLAQYTQVSALHQSQSPSHSDGHPSSPSSTGSQTGSHQLNMYSPPGSPSFQNSESFFSCKRLPSLSTVFRHSNSSKSATYSHESSSAFRNYHQRSRSQEFEKAYHSRQTLVYNSSSQIQARKHHTLPVLSLPPHHARKMSPYHSPLSTRAHSPQSPVAHNSKTFPGKVSNLAIDDDYLPSLVSVLQGLAASATRTEIKAKPLNNQNNLPGASLSTSPTSPKISKKLSIHSLLN